MSDQKKYEQLLDFENVMRILNKISIFAGLSDTQLQSLFQLLKKVSYRAGETIFEEGQEPSHIYIVQSGKVTLVGDKEGTALELIAFDEGR